MPTVRRAEGVFTQRPAYLASMVLVILLVTQRITGQNNASSKHTEVPPPRHTNTTELISHIVQELMQAIITLNDNDEAKLRRIITSYFDNDDLNQFYLATKQKLKRTMLIDNIYFPGAYGGQNIFNCQQNGLCYRVKEDGKPIYYICDRTHCVPLIDAVLAKMYLH